MSRFAKVIRLGHDLVYTHSGFLSRNVNIFGGIFVCVYMYVYIFFSFFF